MLSPNLDLKLLNHNVFRVNNRNFMTELKMKLPDKLFVKAYEVCKKQSILIDDLIGVSLYLSHTLMFILLCVIIGTINNPLSAQIVTAAFTVKNKPTGIAINSGTNLIYFLSRHNENITVVNGATNQAITTIEVDGAPISIQLTRLQILFMWEISTVTIV